MKTSKLRSVGVRRLAAPDLLRLWLREREKVYQVDGAHTLAQRLSGVLVWAGAG